MSDAAEPDLGSAPELTATTGEVAPVAQPLPPEAVDNGRDGIGAMFGWLDISGVENLIGAGGPVTVILLAMSVITLTVILAKLWQFAVAGVGRDGPLHHALGLWAQGSELAALDQLSGKGGPAARVAAHAMSALTAGAEDARAREDTERVAFGELSKLRAYLRVIEATVQTAPLLGLFGTVLGMIASFRALQGAGAQADPAVLAGGIWVALLTTAVGLAIAIPSALALTWFQGRIERERERIEDAATRVFTSRVAAPASNAAAESRAAVWQAEPEHAARRTEAL